jgi:hypothetical protein
MASFPAPSQEASSAAGAVPPVVLEEAEFTLEGGEALNMDNGHQFEASFGAFLAQDGRPLLYLLDTSEVRRWSADDGTMLPTTHFPGMEGDGMMGVMSYQCLSSEGRALLVTLEIGPQTEQNRRRLIDLESGSILFSSTDRAGVLEYFNLPGVGDCVAYSDGNVLRAQLLVSKEELYAVDVSCRLPDRVHGESRAPFPYLVLGSADRPGDNCWFLTLVLYHSERHSHLPDDRRP